MFTNLVNLLKQTACENNVDIEEDFNAFECMTYQFNDLLKMYNVITNKQFNLTTVEVIESFIGFENLGLNLDHLKKLAVDENYSLATESIASTIKDKLIAMWNWLMDKVKSIYNFIMKPFTKEKVQARKENDQKIDELLKHTNDLKTGKYWADKMKEAEKDGKKIDLEKIEKEAAKKFEEELKEKIVNVPSEEILLKRINTMSKIVEAISNIDPEDTDPLTIYSIIRKQIEQGSGVNCRYLAGKGVLTFGTPDKSKHKLTDTTDVTKILNTLKKCRAEYVSRMLKTDVHKFSDKIENISKKQSSILNKKDISQFDMALARERITICTNLVSLYSHTFNAMKMDLQKLDTACDNVIRISNMKLV